ncbi:hypothetical protein PTKIN_Ptkin14bG0025900 [Pterospermum kingtungense]
MSRLQKTCHFVCLVFFSLNFQANLSSSSSVKQSCSHDEASALLQFKRSLSIDGTYFDDFYFCTPSSIKLYPKTDSWKEVNRSAKKYMGVGDNHSNIFYSYSVGMAIKGVEMEVVKIFTMLTSTDLLNNKFGGELPKVIGYLKSLKGFNLSQNNLNGFIADSVGNLINLEWLDLSSNQLIGQY